MGERSSSVSPKRFERLRMAVRGTENFERVLLGKARCFSKRRDGKVGK